MGEKENMQTDYQTLWNKCLAVIKDIVPKAAFDTWFVPIVPLSYEDKKFTIQVPSQFFYEYLEEKYVNVLKVTLYRVIGQGTILNYRIMVDKTTGGTVDYPAENASTAVKKVTPKDANKAPNPFMTTAPQDLDPQLNPKYNFDNYFEGTSNKLVRTAGEAVAQNPGKTTFNPLFIFGPSGVGKTHLCHAIGTRIRELHPEKKVLYVSSHLFRVQFTDAIRKNTTNDFLNFYQNIDVLLLDDIQELIGMDKTQNTFFHIFNHLHQLGKQLILTSDKPPVDDGMYLYSIANGRDGLLPPMPVHELDGSSWPLETVGAMYANFGSLGVLIGMWLVGIIIGSVYNKMIKTNYSFLFVIFYTLMLFTFELSSLRIVQLVMAFVILSVIQFTVNKLH